MKFNPFKKFLSLKKRYKLLVILGILLVSALIALKAAPSVARNYIEKHSREWIGRDIRISDISLSLTSFTLDIDSLTVYEKDGQTPFVGFEQFRINLNPTHLLKKEISVSEIYLGGFFAKVTQNGDKFNFSDILETLGAKDSTAGDDTVAIAEPPKADSSRSDTLSIGASISQALGGLSLSIENINIEKSNVIYEDQKVGSRFKLENFSLQVPSVYFSDRDTDAGINLKFADGGDLSIKFLFNMETENFGILLGLHHFNLASANPYLKDFINYKDFQGSLNIDLDLSGNLKAPLASDIKGHLTLEDISLRETSDKVISLKNLDIGIGKANLDDMDFKVDSVIVDGVNAHFDMFKNGNNISTLLNTKSDTADSSAKAPAPEPAEKSKPLKFVLNKLLLKNTVFTANDNTLQKPFSFKVTGITVSGTNINFNSPCAINISANLPEGGTATLKYKGAFSDLTSMDAYISIKNLPLKSFAPYSHHYTGYPISAGTLAFASDNKMVKNEIDSKNTIDIYNITVDDKDPNSDPEFMVPMKIGLYILKDKDEKIQFDVPVKGNITDPEFSYGKIIWKTVMNLLIKVAVSPLRLVGNLAASGAEALGFDLGKNDEVVIDPLNSSFTSEQFAKAQKMLQVITADPNLKITFVQTFNMKEMVETYRTHKLKTDFYKETQGKKNLNELDEKSILEISERDSVFMAYAAKNGPKLTKVALEKEILDKANRRNQEMLRYLLQQPGVTKKSVKVLTAPRKDLVKHRGKPMYKIVLDVK
ncbi:MAG: DUF748 domain-containing protein [Fibrobacter sp.]|nr:DUF748 domain-containing protein [Fibrobacter sp.]